MFRKRIFDYLIAFLFIISINFLLPRLMPGDPLMVIYGEDVVVSMNEELEQDLTERMGLDKSLGEQFGVYLVNLLKGDLGYSYYYEDSVLNLLLGTLPWTILLVGLALIISTLLGIILGLETGYKRGSFFDKGVLTGLMFLNGFPDFFIGIVLLLIFSVSLGLFPLSGAMTPYSGLTGLSLIFDVLKHLTLPLLALVLSEISACFLLTRTTVITVLGEPFILTAKAKGVREKNIKYRHIGKNSLIPILTRTGIRIGRMFTAILLIETVFSYPGVGYLIYNSLLTRDYPVIQGVFFVIALIVMGINFLVEVVNKKIDPRVT